MGGSASKGGLCGSGPPQASLSEPVSWGLLEAQDASTSSAIIAAFAGDASFDQFAAVEGADIVARDAEDDLKLEAGIKIAVAKGVVPADHVPEPYIPIDVLGKTPRVVADEILGHCGDHSKGVVIVLCGLSGTGKGTTVETLRDRLPDVTCWSNGNIFRSLTLLAATWCEQNGHTDFNAAAALTPELLASFVAMLSFKQFGERGKFDIKISGLGLDYLVSEIANTELKAPKVGKNIPTVAEVTQGEVINFAAAAIGTIQAAGQSVLLEGREATVNFVPTPHRFTLTISDKGLLGQRRAAQRLMAAAFKELSTQRAEGSQDASAKPSDTAVEAVLVRLLAEMAAEAAAAAEAAKVAAAAAKAVRKRFPVMHIAYTPLPVRHSARTYDGSYMEGVYVAT
jgi:cytidylate kinase